MTPKQQLRSIEKKMERLQGWCPRFDLNEATKHISYIQRYYELKQQHFHLKFNIEHCKTCGKKL